MPGEEWNSAEQFQGAEQVSGIPGLPDLLKAHQKLDEAVDRCYRPQPFANELGRLQYLFELYRQYTQPLLKDEKPKKIRRKTVK